MKIGVSLIGYECAEHLKNVLAPWNDMSKEMEIYISCGHGVFPETYELGYPVHSTDGSIELFDHLYENGKIDAYTILPQPTCEHEIRNKTLPFLLDRKIDFLWLLDHDEFYTIDDIKKICSFLERKNDINWFKVHMKNYVFDNRTFIDDFCPPRIWRCNIHNGIKQFYYDNNIEWNNGIKDRAASSMAIPQHIAFIKHLSWVGSDEYLQRKIEFQKKHYGHCSYKWDNGLQFNLQYYDKYNLPMPELQYDE